MKNDNLSAPLITIGITCFNARDTIKRAIESAINQDWPNIEILIVDDCSTDGSIELIEIIKKKHPIISFIKHAVNKGPAGARQTIIDNANGKFIAFFDDDDKSMPERCSIQFQHLKSYEEKTGVKLLACYASGQRIYSNGYTLQINAIGSQNIPPKGYEIADYLLFYGKKKNVFYGAGVPTCALMARKETFIEIGGFDKNFRRVEDVDFAIRLGLAGGHFIGCTEHLYIQYSTQAQDKSPEKNLENEIQLAEKYKDYLRSVGRYEYAKRWPFIRYHHFAGNHLKMLNALIRLFLHCPIKTLSHFMKTAPRRLLHEIKMKKAAQK
tara:strand:- start:483 stop:1454 length:972 start_codon:yes stop_codon:yes gene_type:complete